MKRTPKEPQAIKLEYVPLGDLEKWPKNPKRHDQDAVRASISRFGYVQPIVIDERTGRVVAGHGRIEALAAMRAACEDPPARIIVDGITWKVPVLRGVSFNSEREAEAFLLADNQTTILGGWDNDSLAEMLGNLQAAEVPVIGWDDSDIKDIIDSSAPDRELHGDLDDAPEPPAKSFVRSGDLWVLGDHRLLCGDCTKPEDVARLMGGECINVCVTSPPYATRREYDASSGFVPIPTDEYVEWFMAVQENIAKHLAHDGSFFLNIKEHCEDGQRVLYVKDLTLAMVRRWGWRFVDEFCWRNTRNGVPGGWNNRFKNAWEPVFHFALGGEIRFRPDAVSRATDAAFDYSKQNDKSSSGSGLLGASRAEGFCVGMARPSNVIEVASESGAGEHSAPYPRALPKFFIEAFSDEGDTVYDPFSGSGTTIIAAEETSRRCLAMEISPRYVEVSLRRWERSTGKTAALDGKPSPQVEAERTRHGGNGA